MTRTPFDQFSKQLLETFLAPLGSVNLNREVSGESRWVDLWFEPSVPSAVIPPDLGLLGRIAATPCLIEPFRQQPPLIEVCNCKAKLFAIFAELQRQAEREKRSIPDSLDGFPWLWILASSASESLLSRLELTADDALPGIYLDRADRTALIAINQLPCTEETLWVRLLGKGGTQQGAIAEVLSFPLEDPRRLSVLQLLVTWKVSLEVNGLVEQEDETMVQLSQAYLEWEQRTEQRGIEQGIKQGAEREARSLVYRQLTRKLGELPAAVRSQLDCLPLTHLENLGEALLDFSTLTDLEAWLAQLGTGISD